ncbi:winged helix-turn-helix domain-containing protein [Streptosporangium sp. NPDC048047]|uniref:winged helix-turn-helix domain-containing protein n=1 Tax=Streptosporangium sp. NPDC048047 TaxID=3155748 RepID=UPI0034341AA6
MTQEARRQLTDPVAMRALAHPARLAILNRLQAEGPATATEVAEVVGVTPSAASYHLRMLAKYGFAEDAPARGDARERVWRHSPGGMVLSPEAGDPPEVRAAKDLLIKAVRDHAADEATRALASFDREPAEWQEASIFYRTALLVSAEELGELHRRIDELLDPYSINRRDRAEAPPGARVAEAQVNLFPRAERRPHGLPQEGTHPGPLDG